MVCYQITIRGKVQGVFYRSNAKSKALDLGVKGWVKNETDGSVVIEAEGSKDKLIDLMDWCKKGPVHARVDEVTKKEIGLKNYRKFEIRH